MKKQRIYLDTSVIGGCFDEEFAPWSNGLFEDFKNGLFVPVVSEVTSTEINQAPEHVRDKFTELLLMGANEYLVTDEVEGIADLYVKRKILTKKYRDDALHIAIATVNNIDMLVSWNFKHIVHYDKISMFNSVNNELGYKSIRIYSPREVTSYEKRF